MIEALTFSVHSFGGLMVVKSTLLLGLVFLSSLVLRRASASAQHYLWTMAFAALLTLPAVSYLSTTSPTWQIGIPVLDSADAAIPIAGLDGAEAVAPPRNTQPASTEASARAMISCSTLAPSLPSTRTTCSIWRAA